MAINVHRAGRIIDAALHVDVRIAAAMCMRIRDRNDWPNETVHGEGMGKY